MFCLCTSCTVTSSYSWVPLGFLLLSFRLQPYGSAETFLRLRPAAAHVLTAFSAWLTTTFSTWLTTSSARAQPPAWYLHIRAQCSSIIT